MPICPFLLMKCSAFFNTAMYIFGGEKSKNFLIFNISRVFTNVVDTDMQP